MICDFVKIDDWGCLGVLDLIIEIFFWGNNKEDIEEKFIIYEFVGVLEYWIVYFFE